VLWLIWQKYSHRLALDLNPACLARRPENVNKPRPSALPFDFGALSRGLKDELPNGSTQSQISQPILAPTTRPAAAKFTLLENSVLASSGLINLSE